MQVIGDFLEPCNCKTKRSPFQFLGVNPLKRKIGLFSICRCMPINTVTYRKAGRQQMGGGEGRRVPLPPWNHCAHGLLVCAQLALCYGQKQALSSGLQSFRKRDTAKQRARKFSGSLCSPLFPQFLKPNLLPSNQNLRGGLKGGQANSERPDGTVQALPSTSTTSPRSSSLTGQGSGLVKSRGQRG